MKKRKSKSWSMAYCGMAAALCVALMLLGTIIPIAMFIAPAVASFLIATVCMECGITMAWTAYAAVSLLGLLFVPDKEIALICHVRSAACAGTGGQRLAGAAHHRTGNVPAHTGHGQRGLCPV